MENWGEGHGIAREFPIGKMSLVVEVALNSFQEGMKFVGAGLLNFVLNFFEINCCEFFYYVRPILDALSKSMATKKLKEHSNNLE